uniref:Uncharacterized protein n=1 Tax=Haptolina brevifila TaxID=156173 RepID=A0A7S2G2G8_9EUKA|mmetsp:Transcript_26233/g.52594  ORF Transcript_26233/g.52594 Transcript_26233/m.52594 type:complete len:427 (+) Transcript_26233:81-1361(+)
MLLISQAEQSTLEILLADAVMQSIRLSPGKEQFAFIGQCLLAHVESTPPPTVDEKKVRATNPSRSELNAELKEIANVLSRKLNATRGQSAPIRALAEALVGDGPKPEVPPPAPLAVPSTLPSPPKPRPAATTKKLLKSLPSSKQMISRNSTPETISKMNVASWTESFMATDPRKQLYELFQPGTEPSALEQAIWAQMGGQTASSYFTVWRPTSYDAIRLMMEGKATGKSLNVKGKSAKKGKLSGLVPFLQISDAAHKDKLPTSPATAVLRLYFKSPESRDAAQSKLEEVRQQMAARSSVAKAAIAAHDAEEAVLDESALTRHLMTLRTELLEGAAAQITTLEESGYGLEIGERLFVQVYIQQADISHPPGWETGRPSEPDYMDLNLQSARKVDPLHPRVVIFQFDDQAALNPRGLLVAYEVSRGSV